MATPIAIRSCHASPGCSDCPACSDSDELGTAPRSAKEQPCALLLLLVGTEIVVFCWLSVWSSFCRRLLPNGSLLPPDWLLLFL